MRTIEQLQADHGIADRIVFRRSAEGAELIEVRAVAGQALVALRGAQVLSSTPRGHADLLWLSPTTGLAGPEAIRGGVPVCWPWFADHPTDASKPAHGFARTAPWQVRRTAATDEGKVLIELDFATAAEHARLWPHAARARLRIIVGDDLALQLETENTGATPFELTQALHAYFSVGEVGRAEVAGLDGTDYLDKVDDFARKRQTGPVTFPGEVDRIHVATTATTMIVDPVMGRRIAIAKSGSASTVVWSPGPTRAARLADIADGWRGFVCVETANAGDDVVRLAPGGRHVMTATYAVTRLP